MDEVTVALVRTFVQFMAVPVVWLLGWQLWKGLTR